MYDKIAIVRKIGNGLDPVVDDLAHIVATYGEDYNIPVYDHHLGTNLPEDAMDVLFVSLGGDGTLIYTAQVSMQYDNASIVGFNLGNLGFLTEDIMVGESTRNYIYTYLDAIFNGQDTVKADKRMMLSSHVYIDRRLVASDPFHAMNEITLYTSLRNFIDTDVAINGLEVGTYGGNGATVTTSTGSTALGLSAGGALISPQTYVMQIVPLLPHKVAKQPIITSGNDSIRLRSEVSHRSQKLYVLADSRQICELDYGKDEHVVDVVIKKARKDVVIWRPQAWNFFNVLAQKMDWK